MEYVKYRLTDDEYIPAIVELGEKSTPVWRQNRWDKGEFSEYIRNDGCGHCCAAMAATLNGVSITSYEEYEYCRKMWGPPKLSQRHYMSISGITKVLNSLDIPAFCYGVKGRQYPEVGEQITESLKNGKQVIFWSNPLDDFPENPFSKGEHYVMAVGFDEDGRIVVANSSEKWTSEGIQKVDINTILRALRKDCDPADKTWGDSDNHDYCAGYIIVG